MRVFFRNIPPNTTINELAHFINIHLNRGFMGLFGERGSLKQIEILEQIDELDKFVRYHGIASIENEKCAERMMKRLRKALFKGKRISVREFVIRTWHNDRRDQATYNSKLSNDRRKKDRRKYRLEKVNQAQTGFTSDTIFSRKFGY